jgi:hypothetical protein
LLVELRKAFEEYEERLAEIEARLARIEAVLWPPRAHGEQSMDLVKRIERLEARLAEARAA